MVGLGNEAVDGGLEIDDGSEDNKRLGIERPVAEYAHIPHSQLGSRAQTNILTTRVLALGKFRWTQVQVRKTLQLRGWQFPIHARSSEFHECPMQGISCDLDHFGVVEIMGAQKDWNLKADRRPLNLKRDTHVCLQLASRGHLNSCHRNFIQSYRQRLVRNVRQAPAPPRPPPGLRRRRGAPVNKNSRKRAPGPMTARGDSLIASGEQERGMIVNTN